MEMLIIQVMASHRIIMKPFAGTEKPLIRELPMLNTPLV